MRNLVVAYGGNRVIGAQNELPWRGQMPADMEHFKALTRGHAVIMGRKTFESIGRPLPRRINYVVTRTVMDIAGCIVVPDIDEAIAQTDHTPSYVESFVIGGERVYRDALPCMDRLYVTEISGNFAGDAFFPNIDHNEWALTASEDHEADAQNAFDYRFMTYDRITS